MIERCFSGRRRLLVAAALLGLVWTSSAQAAAPAQEESGTVLLPLRFAADATYASWPGGQRTVYSVAGSNGHVGYTIDLSEAVDGGRFELVSDGGVLSNADFDIAFYASFTPTVSTATIASRGVGGEAGTIPTGSRYAIVTLFDGANAGFTFRAWEPENVSDRVRGLVPAALPAAPGIYPTYGFTGERVDRWIKRLRSRSHVVIAVVDTGINPYHVAYRRPEYAVHPSTYIEGFPADTPALGVNLGEPD